MWKRLYQNLYSNTTRTMSSKTKVLKVDPSCIHFSPTSYLDGSLPIITDPITKQNLMEAANIIRNTNEVIAFPTETVYGLGGSALSNESVLNIYKAKNRPSDNPLISHISSIDQLNRRIFNEEKNLENIFRNIPEVYHPLINNLWPGPLTILLSIPPNSKLSHFATAGQTTFAVRIPESPVARALIALSDTPIAAPSANTSTKPSPTTALHVIQDLDGRIPLILDGGSCHVGVESTVVDGLVSPPVLLRPGGFTYEEISKLGGPNWEHCVVEKKMHVGNMEKVRTPGMKYKHYSPKAKLILFTPEMDKIPLMERIHCVKTIIERESKGFKTIGILTSLVIPQDLVCPDNSSKYICESLGSNRKEIQSNLFAFLRKLDEDYNVDLIFVEGTDKNEEGLAIMNRLIKAAGGNIIPF